MKVEIENATLYLGDCREILSTLDKVDAVVTDPPYGIGADKKGAHSSIRDNDAWANMSWDDHRPQREVFDLLREVSDHQIIWGGNYFADFLPPTMHWLVWDKGVRGFSLADCELAWSSQQKAARIFTLARATAQRDGRHHPTQKSIELMKWCLGFVKDATTICDPFMGSGTTGVAAVQMGRKFIGIEREQRYFDIAYERIEVAASQTSLFMEAPATRDSVNQTALFG